MTLLRLSAEDHAVLREPPQAKTMTPQEEEARELLFAKVRKWRADGMKPRRAVRLLRRIRNDAKERGPLSEEDERTILKAMDLAEVQLGPDLRDIAAAIGKRERKAAKRLEEAR